MWVVVKRTGGYIAPLPNLEPFNCQEDAEEFARRFLASNPNAVARGREAIEVRPYRASNA